MMKQRYVLFSIGLMASSFIACKKSTNLCTDKSAPSAVTNPQVQGLPGAAKITYTLPSNSNLLYVKAVWQYNGVTKEAKSSLYENNVLLEGFNDTIFHDVKLYAVSNCEISSDAVTVKVKPQLAPIWGVYNSLT